MASEDDQPHHRPNGGVRARLLQEELDRRFAAVHKEIDQRQAAVEAMRAALVAELDRRFDDTRREVDQRFDSTIHMRVALQEEMDRRFADLSSQLDRRFMDSERAVGAALAAAKEAVLKAETASERRFEGVNEFRAQLNDQARTFMGRNEYLSAHKSLTDKVDAAITVLTDRISKLDSRLTSRLDLGTGRDSGQDAVRVGTRANIATGVAILAVIVSVIILVVNVTKHLRGLDFLPALKDRDSFPRGSGFLFHWAVPPRMTPGPVLPALRRRFTCPPARRPRCSSPR